jgi:type IV secretion system protein VirB8
MKMIFKYVGTIFGNRNPSNLILAEHNYYDIAKDWHQEIYESVSVSRNRYRIFCLLLSFFLALTIFLTIALLPLKQYAYRLIEVNQQTGEVIQLKEIDGNHYTANWAITHYFISQYVMNRHVYSIEDIKRTFNNALSMSQGEIAERYSQQILDSNPNSPINILKKDYYREVTILGINQLDDRTALIRFYTTTHHRTNVTEFKKEDFQAVIKWEYHNHPESLEDRDLNPLGFMVTYYHVTPVNTSINA